MMLTIWLVVFALNAGLTIDTKASPLLRGVNATAALIAAYYIAAHIFDLTILGEAV